MKKTNIVALIFILSISLLSLVLSSGTVFARIGHMTLLTVGERGNETFGSTADVYLEVKPGTGRVFFDSFPLTQLDTQISTRFAKEVACDFLVMDCSNKDFFYTIRAKSSIVGGPSAGAAMAVLTVAVLDNDKLNESVVMTGTINSGGIVGPVAGIKEKVDAAKSAGFKKALIPKRSIISGEEYLANLSKNNSDINLSDKIVYADSFHVDGIDVQAVSTLEDALFEFTGKKYPDYSYNLTVPAAYNDIMKNVSIALCNRAKEINFLIDKSVKSKKAEQYNYSMDFLSKANVSFVQGDYYSSASFCFNANSQLRDIEYSTLSKKELNLIAMSAQQDTNKLLDQVNKRDMKTLSELETSMIVKERLLEAKDLLSKNESDVNSNLAYIVERIYSAEAWSAFFSYPGKNVQLDKVHLADACLSKIAEAEERVNYLELLFGKYDDARKDISDTKQIYESGDYAYCLFKATRIKADANAVLASLSVTEEKFPSLIDDQLGLSRIQINKQGENFPILGYSYYDYANSLKSTKPALSVLFSEYALEFSNLDMYFPRAKSHSIYLDSQRVGLFMLGIAAGILATIVILVIMGKRARKKEKRKEKIGKKNIQRKKR